MDWNGVANWVAPLAGLGVIGVARWVRNVSSSVKDHHGMIHHEETGLDALNKRGQENRERIVAVERDQEHSDRTLDRLESKVDRILERLSGRNGVQ